MQSSADMLNMQHLYMLMVSRVIMEVLGVHVDGVAV
jgi:hypothetical protein